MTSTQPFIEYKLAEMAAILWHESDETEKNKAEPIVQWLPHWENSAMIGQSNILLHSNKHLFFCYNRWLFEMRKLQEHTAHEIYGENLENFGWFPERPS